MVVLALKLQSTWAPTSLKNSFVARFIPKYMIHFFVYHPSIGCPTHGKDLGLGKKLLWNLIEVGSAEFLIGDYSWNSFYCLNSPLPFQMNLIIGYPSS